MIEVRLRLIMNRLKEAGITFVGTETFEYVREIDPQQDKSGTPYKRTKIVYSFQRLLVQYRKKAVLFGDIPPDVLTLLRAGRRFTLETVYEGKGPVPVSQNLLIIDETRGPTKYRFTRKTREPPSH